MDTNEKSETPQPSTKNSSQKEQNDNSVAGMCPKFNVFAFVLFI